MNSSRMRLYRSGRAPRDVRAEPHLRVLVQPVARGQRLRVAHVEAGHRHPVVVERDAERVLVDEGAPGDVDDVHAGLDRRERVRVEQVPGVRGGGRGDDQVIGTRQQLREIHDLDARDRAGRARAPGGDHAHPERQGPRRRSRCRCRPGRRGRACARAVRPAAPTPSASAARRATRRARASRTRAWSRARTRRSAPRLRPGSTSRCGPRRPPPGSRRHRSRSCAPSARHGTRARAGSRTGAWPAAPRLRSTGRPRRRSAPRRPPPRAPLP